MRSMMLNLLVGAGLVITTSAPALASLAKVADTTDFEVFDGRWHAEDDAILTIQVRQDTLSVSGVDGATSFQSRCIAEMTDSGPTARCIGEGYNFLNKRNFLYVSTIAMKDDKLVESWNARFLDASGAIESEFEGEQSFTKQVPSSR